MIIEFILTILIVGFVTAGLNIRFDRFFTILLLLFIFGMSITSAINIFLWVIMAVIELLGLMGTLSGIIAILLVPKDIAIELMRLEGNRNAIDMLRAYIDRLEASEIRNSSIHIDNRLNALNVTQSIGHNHTTAVTEAMAKNANANNLLLAQFSEKYDLIGNADVKK